MSVTLSDVSPGGVRVFMGTFTNGMDVHTALAEIATRLNIGAATVEMLGGLTEVELSEYDFVNHVRKSPLTFARPLEVLSGQGTISRLDDAPHVHLHFVMSFRDEAAPHGMAVIGGHVARATAFALEFTLTAYNGPPVQRALHEPTGLQLWELPAQ